jgi:hypothetical protein
MNVLCIGGELSAKEERVFGIIFEETNVDLSKLKWTEQSLKYKKDDKHIEEKIVLKENGNVVMIDLELQNIEFLALRRIFELYMNKTKLLGCLKLFIVILNLDAMRKSDQAAFRVLSEKCYESVQIFGTATSDGQIIEPIKSRFSREILPTPAGKTNWYEADLLRVTKEIKKNIHKHDVVRSHLNELLSNLIPPARIIDCIRRLYIDDFADRCDSLDAEACEAQHRIVLGNKELYHLEYFAIWCKHNA